MKNDRYDNTNNLDNLFQSARNQNPEYNLLVVQTHFISASQAGISPKFDTQFTYSNFSTFLKSKFFIMTLSTISILSIAILTTNTSKGKTDDQNTTRKLTELAVLSSNSVRPDTTSIVYSGTNLQLGPKRFEKMTILNHLGFSPFYTAQYHFDYSFITPIELKKDEAKDTLLKIYLVNEHTTKEELNEIKAAAKSAGLEMFFFAKFKNNRIKRFNYSIRDNSKNQGTKFANIAPFRSKTEINHQISWRTNREGEFLDFGTPKKIVSQCVKSKYSESQNSIPKKTVSANVGAQKNNDTFSDTSKEKTVHFEEDIMLNKGDKEVYQMISHLIHPKTTEEELVQIQKAALSAGIKFEIQVAYKKEILQKLEILMIIRTENGNLESKIHITKRRGESFSIPVIWRLNENGKAVDFGTQTQLRIIGGN